MKKSIIILISVLSLFAAGSCSEWLDVYPQNDQMSDYYWQSKEEVDAVVNSGYFYLRENLILQLIPFGELRAGCIKRQTSGNTDLQRFNVRSTNKDVANWGPFYQIINVANMVIKKAEGVLQVDETYDVNVMKSHKTEAYFLRALSYFYLVRNWRDVPMSLEPYETDEAVYILPQTPEKDVVLQIKKDIRTALELGAAKEQYEKEWESKGRATKWALYALMADVCLWNEDYIEAAQYCNYLLEAQSEHAPRFMSTPTRESWFSIFNPGNSAESIFEIQYDYERGSDQMNNLPVLFDDLLDGRMYEYSSAMINDFNDEYRYNLSTPSQEAVRTMYGGYYIGTDPTVYLVATQAWVWKYLGSTFISEKRSSGFYDPHFIIYRMADVILMRAEALIMQGRDLVRWQEAVDLVNMIRARANLEPITLSEEDTELSLLQYVLRERKMELAGEGKIWYDILRMGRRNNSLYKNEILLSHVLEYNLTSTSAYFRSTLSKDDALFLPVWDKELEANELLIQNPHYK